MRQVFLLCQLTQAVIRQVSAITCQRAFFKERKYVATNFLKDLLSLCFRSHNMQLNVHLEFKR